MYKFKKLRKGLSNGEKPLRAKVFHKHTQTHSKDPNYQVVSNLNS